MKLIAPPIEKSINKGYLKTNVSRERMNRFKDRLRTLYGSLNAEESEEHNKNNVSKFLNDAFYEGRNYVNTKDRTDLVIHAENSPASPVVVMLETKKPENKTEMISENEVNKKAFWELALYYLRERVEEKNYEIKNLVVTDGYDWFFFKASEFERLFYNSDFRENYNKWASEKFVDSKTPTFYDFAKHKIEESNETVECAHLDLREYESVFNDFTGEKDEELIPLYKLFSPQHLLNEPFANDSNSLNKDFYYELLYILGLEESEKSGKKLIGRASEKNREYGSIIENIIRKLETEHRLSSVENPKEYGADEDEQRFGLALELALIWLNRILFMKLLESQLTRFNGGDEAYKFLSPDKINQFDELNTMFFSVLNSKEEERYEYLRERFEFLPYLNSALFDLAELETKFFTISALEDKIKLPLYRRTVLKNEDGSRRKGEEYTPTYLLKFLDAYDFGATGDKKIVEEDKELISASVLGLVFEKINGYKDGSYFTPGAVTMYMAEESIKLAAVQKFNDRFGWQLENYVDLYNKMDKVSQEEANELIDDLKICDPAAGSGHFLVSALNEIIALKSDLGLLFDKNGRKLFGYRITVENDELHIEDEKLRLFEYQAVGGDSKKGRKINSEKQRVQETIFEEKRKIIENCLFGVDINPNSVHICRLRLWIELLKSAYYTEESDFRHMETLPNIDINIKSGNSLISKYGFDGALPLKDKPTLEEYKRVVKTYKNATDRGVKAELKSAIERIKKKFRGFWTPENKELSRLAEELHMLNSENNMFQSEKEKERARKKKEKLEKKIEELREKNASENNEEIYRSAFEWRFEFPEVLDEDGRFTGFDIVIGNPPYIQLQKEHGKLAKLYADKNYKTLISTGDIYSLFYERGWHILKEKGYLAFITSNKWMRAGYGEKTRKFLADNTNPLILIDFGGVKVFDAATVDANVLIYKKWENGRETKVCALKSDFSLKESLDKYVSKNSFFTSAFNTEKSWIIQSPIEERIKKKIEAIGTPLREWDVNIYRGILTGYNKAFIIDGKKKKELIAEDPRSAEVLKPILRGRDIKRYKADFADLWLILFPKGFTIKTMQKIRREEGVIKEPPPRYGWEEYDDAWNFIISNYPAIAKHLIKYKDKAEKRLDKGDYWWELRACAYMEEFEKEKIIYIEIQTDHREAGYEFPCFTFGEKSTFVLNTAYILTGKYFKYILAILNSSFGRLLVKNYVSQLQKRQFRMLAQYVQNFPIPKITENEQKPFIKLLDKILSVKKADSGADTREWEDRIDLMVYKLYDLTYEECKVVGADFDKVLERFDIIPADYESMSVESLGELGEE